MSFCSSALCRRRPLPAALRSRDYVAPRPKPQRAATPGLLTAQPLSDLQPPKPSPLHRPLVGAFVRHGDGRAVRQLLVGLLRQRRPGPLVARLQPSVSLRSRRKAGVTYRVPFIIRQRGRVSYALRWLRAAVRQRPERTFRQRLEREFADVAAGRGEAVRRMRSTHQLALHNRGFLRLL